MGSKVLYLDDEMSRVQEYRDYLSDLGLDVYSFEGTDTAFDWLTQNQADIECVILDVMLPPGTRYDGPTTNYGLLTGIAFYKDIRQFCGPFVPIFMLTNNTDPAIQEAIGSDEYIEVILKPDVLYDEFGDLVLDTLRKKKGEE